MRADHFAFVFGDFRKRQLYFGIKFFHLLDERLAAVFEVGAVGRRRLDQAFGNICSINNAIFQALPSVWVYITQRRMIRAGVIIMPRLHVLGRLSWVGMLVAI